MTDHTNPNSCTTPLAIQFVIPANTLSPAHDPSPANGAVSHSPNPPTGSRPTPHRRRCGHPATAANSGQPAAARHRRPGSDRPGPRGRRSSNAVDDR